MPAAPSFPPIRRLGPDDLKRCVALSVDRGWSPEASKWSLLLVASAVFGVDAPDGRGLAGAVALTRWAADYAAVGMMLVAARYGRRGLGRALMDHALRAAGRGATVTLFATDMGRPLYEKLGFAAVRRNVPFVGRFRALPGDGAGGVRAATPADLPAILDLDRAAFGADRGHILSRLYTLVDRMVVAEAGGPPGGGLAGGLDRERPLGNRGGPARHPRPGPGRVRRGPRARPHPPVHPRRPDGRGGGRRPEGPRSHRLRSRLA